MPLRIAKTAARPIPKRLVITYCTEERCTSRSTPRSRAAPTPSMIDSRSSELAM